MKNKPTPRLPSGKTLTSDKGKVDTETKEKQTLCVHVETRVSRVYKALNDPTTKLYCLFLHNSIPLFEKFNTLLQSDKPYIYLLRRELYAILSEIYIRFLKPEVISKSTDLKDIKYNDRKNQKDRDDLLIGSETRDYLKSISISSQCKDLFYKSVRSYFTSACDYILTKFPLDDPVLLHAEVSDVKLRTKEKFSSLKFFLERYPVLSSIPEDQLCLQFSRYQIEDLSNILESVHGENDRLDVIWTKIGQIIDTDGTLKYSELAQCMLGILVIPHSNVDSERIFSHVRKNKTDFRPNLSDYTLSALMVHKTYMLAEKSVCYKMSSNTELLKKAKSATYKSLQK